MNDTPYSDEIKRETEYDDDIADAMCDAMCNADGRHSPKYLRAELMTRGLCIAQDVPMAWTVTNVQTGIMQVFMRKDDAAATANFSGCVMEPLYAAVK